MKLEVTVHHLYRLNVNNIDLIVQRHQFCDSGINCILLIDLRSFRDFLNPADFETTYVLILIKEFSEIFYYLIIQRSYNTLVPREMLVPPQ